MALARGRVFSGDGRTNRPVHNLEGFTNLADWDVHDLDVMSARDDDVWAYVRSEGITWSSWAELRTAGTDWLLSGLAFSFVLLDSGGHVRRYDHWAVAIVSRAVAVQKGNWRWLGTSWLKGQRFTTEFGVVIGPNEWRCTAVGCMCRLALRRWL